MRFVSELRRAFSRIRNGPRRWPLYLRGTRRCLLKGFPYLVVYREWGPDLQIIAIAHGRRRPGYWKDRLN